MSPRSICIVCHQAYGAISGGGAKFIGGVEWQTSLLAQWLASHGHRVSLVTWDEGGPGEERFNGVRVIKVCRSDAGFKGMRFFYPRWTSLLAALRRANADVYYHNCAEAMTGQIAAWCKSNRRAFVYSVASDADCSLDLPQLSKPLERALYRSGLRNANLRIVQTQRQRQTLEALWGLNSVVIPMPCPEPPRTQSERQKNCVLWIGRVCRVKRPDWLVELARMMPEAHFDFVGPTYGDPYSTAVCEQARQLPNITIHGAIDRERVHEFYSRASVLCCTSEYEGFPNTFLEAWSHGVPVVATVNPDNLLTERRLGSTAATIEGLAAGIRRIMASDRLRAELSASAETYFRENHNAQAVLPRFEQVIAGTARERNFGVNAGESYSW